MLEGVYGKAARVCVGVTTELVLVHAERVASLAGDRVSGLCSRQIGHYRLDEVVDVEDRLGGVARVIQGQIERCEE